MGLLTDGRSITQRNKISSLGLQQFINESNIIISEEIGVTKLSEKGFVFFMTKFPHYNYYYIGDNPLKDFFIPNKLGWNTICMIDDKRNIHKQDFNLNDEYLPKQTINNLSEILKDL